MGTSVIGSEQRDSVTEGPLLAASIAYHTGYLTPAAGFVWLGTWAALITLATATAVGKVPLHPGALKYFKEKGIVK